MKLSTTLAITAFAALAVVGGLSADNYNSRGYNNNYYSGRSNNNDGCGCDTCKPAPRCCQPTPATCCRPYKACAAPAKPCAAPVKKCCGPQTRWECPKACCNCGGNHMGYSYARNGEYRTTYIDTTYSMDAHNQRYHGNGQAQYSNTTSPSRNQVAYADPRATSEYRSFAQPTMAGTTDDSIMQSIQTALQNDSTLSETAKNITISVNNGVVTLSGNVANAAEKARIESMAQVSGVTSVTNQINVR